MAVFDNCLDLELFLGEISCQYLHSTIDKFPQMYFNVPNVTNLKQNDSIISLSNKPYMGFLVCYVLFYDTKNKTTGG